MRRIVSAKIKFLSLVPRGANQLPVIYKSDDGVELSSLVKASDNFDEKGELLSVVYAPELRDSQGDIASADVIKEAMYSAAKDGFDLDIRHDGKALSKDDAYVAESFIVQKGDTRFDGFTNYKGEKVDVTGGWATVIKIDHEGLRKAYREGKWNGVSMAGTAEFASEKQDLDGFVEKLATLLKTPNDGDFDMKPEELSKILADNNQALLDGIAKALKPEGPAKEDKTEKQDETAKSPAGPKPVLKDATDAKAVAEYQTKLKAWKAAQDVDWDDPESVAEYQKSLAVDAEEDTVADADADIDKEDSDEVKALKKKLAKAQRASNAKGEGKGSASPQPVQGGFSKEEIDLMEAGRKSALAYQKSQGR